MIGGSFGQVGGGQFDPNDRFDTFDFNEYFEPKQRNGVRNRVNVARLIGGATPGPGNVGLLAPDYPANKSQGFIYALLTRTNGSLGYASANFSVVPGTAQAGADYIYNATAPMYPIEWEYIGPSRMHSDGLWGTNTVMNDAYGRALVARIERHAERHRRRQQQPIDHGQFTRPVPVGQSAERGPVLPRWTKHPARRGSGPLQWRRSISRTMAEKPAPSASPRRRMRAARMRSLA